MEVFVLTESYLDYKGADATTHGVYKTMKGAIRDFKKIVKEIFDNVVGNMETKAEVDRWINSQFKYKKGYAMKWAYDDGDSVYTFYIDKIKTNI